MSAPVRTPRFRFIEAALSKLGAPYIWAAKGPDFFDCSGLVTYALRVAGGPDWTGSHWSARMFEELPEAKAPKPGDLAFYGGDTVSHVVICLGEGVGIVGANGGDSTTKAPKPGACVSLKPSANYRKDLRGFRSLAKQLKETP